MPQPYLQVRRNGAGHFSFQAGAINRYPHLAAQIGLVTANWAQVDAEVQLILCAMLGVRAELVTAIYWEIQAANARDAVIRAVAQKELSDSNIDLFEALWDLQSSPNRQRNAVVHGVWGVSEDIVDALIMINPRDLHKRDARMSGILENAIGRGTVPDTSSFENVLEHYMVYRQSDFDSLNEEITRTRSYWSRFRGLLVFRHFGDQEEINRWRESLCNEPAVRQALNKIQRGRQSGP